MTMFATMLRRVHPDGRIETIGEPDTVSVSWRTIGDADEEVPGWGWIFKCDHADLVTRYGADLKILLPPEKRGPDADPSDPYVGTIGDLDPDGRYELFLIECY